MLPDREEMDPLRSDGYEWVLVLWTTSTGLLAWVCPGAMEENWEVLDGGGVLGKAGLPPGIARGDSLWSPSGTIRLCAVSFPLYETESANDWWSNTPKYKQYYANSKIFKNYFDEW